jgi:sigma-E factor negative regulatory protein RseB
MRQRGLGQRCAAPPDAAPRMLDPLKLMGWYDLSVAGKSRVAGRDAVIVTLTPARPAPLCLRTASGP